MAAWFIPGSMHLVYSLLWSRNESNLIWFDEINIKGTWCNTQQGLFYGWEGTVINKEGL